jgi:tetratricopeptide (TPR) repeat protein
MVAVLVIITLGVYAPVLRNGFVNYDDPRDLLGNPHLNRGFTLGGLAWAFSMTEYPNWHPLTWISHMLDFQLFGFRAGLHHAVSAIIHAANAALLFLLLRQGTGALWPSAVVAAVFALHPLRVESVAWASERKDVLSMLFGLLSLAAYLGFARRRSAAAYGAAVALFACSLMAKAMFVTLPAILLLLDFWPLGRWPVPGRGLPISSPRLVAEKTPFLALSLAAGVLALIAQRGAGTVATLDHYPLLERIATACRASGFYLWKTLWPTGLAIFYPNLWRDVPRWQPLLAAAILVAITAVACRAARRWPAVFVGWSWYLITLAPVIGIVQVGSQSMADRYTYFPQVGLLLAVSWPLAGAIARSPRLRMAAAGAAIALIAAAAGVSARQVTHWRTSETLFAHAIRVTENNYVALTNLGNALADSGRFREAVGLYREALNIKPNFDEAHYNLGNALARLGRTAEAMHHLQAALVQRPDFLEARNNLGLMLLSVGRQEEAIVQFREALRTSPEDPRVRRNLERALAGQQRS